MLQRSPNWRLTIDRWLRSPVTFYLVIPLTLAVTYTFLRSGLAALMTFPNGLLFFGLMMPPSWWAAHVMARIAHIVLRPWTPPLWLICVVGSISQALVLSPYYRLFHAWAVANLTISGRIEGDWPLPAFTVEYITALAWVLTPGALIWTAANYFYDRVLNVPRFRYSAPATSGAPEPSLAAAPPVESPPSVEPERPVEPAPAQALLTRSKLPVTAEIRALTAEEHYVRLFTDVGTDLVRYRFSDAVEEMAGVAAGMQVHRSWWVRLDRVANWHVNGRSCELELDHGLRIPISLAFREAVLARAPAEVRDRARRGSQREESSRKDQGRASSTG